MSLERRIGTLLIVAVIMCVGCSGAGRLARRSSPYEQYVAMLGRAGLDATSLGRQWMAAGTAAVSSAAPIASPFAESGYFAAAEPTAAAFRLDLQRGRRVVIAVAFESVEPGRLFVDLFRTESTGELRHVAALENDTPQLEYTVERTGSHVLRIQPELLRTGRFTLSERTVAVLRTFPVRGLTTSAVQSGFGAERDRGARSHEGIDIFAGRGTPVVAVVDGLAEPDTNRLGGNVVWLRDRLVGGARYYYAHLDRWAIAGGTRVQAGDVLGFVGNTGNAGTTAPHLHFGIYDDGALDPAPFLQPDEDVTAPPVDPALLGALVRTRGTRTALRAGPSAGAPERILLEPDTIGRRLGVAGRWHRVLLADRTVGYVPGTTLTAAAVPLRHHRPSRTLELREQPQATAPVMAAVAPGVDLEVLGRFKAYELVRTAHGAAGWIEAIPRGELR